MEPDEIYMLRCLQLAKLGIGNVAPNPMVGAVLVHNDIIIGEGYHERYGKAHAEVNCLNSVKRDDYDKISESTLYVSLEPCAHYGKTPPCSDLIIKHNIKKVIIGCRDPFIEVNGRGIEQLISAGIEVICEILKDKCIELNKRFFTFHTKKRPYIILKWAQSADLIIGNGRYPVRISNHFTDLIVHKWRSEEIGIMVGTNTVKVDNPSLTNRYWKGSNPKRLIIDLNLRLPQDSHVYNDSSETIIFNYIHNEIRNNITFKTVSSSYSDNTIKEIVNECYSLNIQSILVEGGSKLLQSFIDADLWDEARIITNTTLNLKDGIQSPIINNVSRSNRFKIMNDVIEYYENN